MKLLMAIIFSVLTSSGCTSYAPLKTVDYVNIEEFMGDWFVVANIPTFIEKEAFNPVESYRLQKDGSISTTYSFNDGSFDGEVKTYHPTGFIKDTKSNALWGMQFIWPFEADYRIVYLDENYENTIVGRVARDYVWIMSRQPVLTEAKFNEFREYVEKLGYDITKLQKVPQRWPLKQSVKQPLEPLS